MNEISELEHTEEYGNTSISLLRRMEQQLSSRMTDMSTKATETKINPHHLSDNTCSCMQDQHNNSVNQNYVTETEDQKPILPDSGWHDNLVINADVVDQGSSSSASKRRPKFTDCNLVQENRTILRDEKINIIHQYEVNYPSTKHEDAITEIDEAAQSCSASKPDLIKVQNAEQNTSHNREDNSLNDSIISLVDAQEGLRKVITHLEIHAFILQDDLQILERIQEYLDRQSVESVSYNQYDGDGAYEEEEFGAEEETAEEETMEESTTAAQATYESAEQHCVFSDNDDKNCREDHLHDSDLISDHNNTDGESWVSPRTRKEHKLTRKKRKPKQAKLTTGTQKMKKSEEDQGSSIEWDVIAEATKNVISEIPTNHMKDDRPNICGTCNKGFKKKRDLQRHMRIHTGERPFKCTYCEKAFADRSTRNTHVRTHTGEKPYECSMCDKAFGDSSTRNAHYRRHTGAKMHKCSVCNKTFTHAGHLRAHAVIHTGEKPHKCSVCERGFSDRSTLRQHMRLHTGDRPYSCNVCGKVFAHSSNYQTHMKLHKGEMPHKCSSCDVTFVWASQLSRHMHTHTGEQNLKHKCSECGKTFAQSCNLQAHMRIHTGEKPFQCSFCGKVFNHSGSLTVHTRTHTGERPYKCDVCNKDFSHAISLQTHKRTHTGEKPYVCATCGKGFAQSGTFRRHMRMHTGEKPYECPTCGDKFSIRSNLNKHMKVHGNVIWENPHQPLDVNQVLDWQDDNAGTEKAGPGSMEQNTNMMSSMDAPPPMSIFDSMRYFRGDQSWTGFR